ncbi:hypothetical protein RJT34_02714 [Clitoria ternatea]|uniref:Uncharacterized protein n=1 Tax=Clitoria ternatea TaxID=43366 RepID=A0AAN9Q129_CLITE
MGMYSTRGSGSIADSYKVFNEMHEKIEQHKWVLYWTALRVSLKVPSLELSGFWILRAGFLLFCVVSVFE